MGDPNHQNAGRPEEGDPTPPYLESLSIITNINNRVKIRAVTTNLCRSTQQSGKPNEPLFLRLVYNRQLMIIEAITPLHKREVVRYKVSRTLQHSRTIVKGRGNCEVDRGERRTHAHVHIIVYDRGM